jgi:hypothetical protein
MLSQLLAYHRLPQQRQQSFINCGGIIRNVKRKNLAYHRLPQQRQQQLFIN